MPRRTKLLITALFLVLLGIPVTYVAVTWSPVDPLTFRVVPLGKPMKWPYGGDHTWVGVRVENTSATTIHLSYALLHLIPATEAVGGVYPENPAARRRLGDWDFAEIPPRGSINVVALVGKNEVNDANAGRLQVSYSFMSSTKRRTTELVVWLSKLLPEKLSPKMPLPEMDGAETALGEMTD